MTSPVLTHGLSADRESVNRHLTRLFAECSVLGDTKVHEAMRYAVLGEGQRLRPILALRTARTLQAREEYVLPAAAAVEMLHCASLIVDDLPCMDDEAYRRGRPTVHKQFGESTAILAAFALVALAGRVVIDRSAPAQVLLRQLDFQDRLLGMLDCSSLIAGQALDLRLGEHANEATRSYVNQLKTVPLFQLSVRAGLVDHDPGAPVTAALLEFGRQLGAAYQAVDDLLDGHTKGRETADARVAEARESLAAIPEDTQELEGLLAYIHAKTWQ